MTTLSTLLVKLGIDKTDYDKGLDDAEKKTGATLKAIGDKMSSVGKTMSLYVTAPIVGGFALSIKAASDMNETLSKSNVVFGDSAKAVQAFTSSAATNLGMTNKAALEAAGTFGNLFVSMGMGQAPAADMSTDLLQLAADLASFNNLDPTEVLEKLRSGLVGETEPLRSLGVNISETAMKAQALAMGLGDATGNLTEAEKVTARYALIMQQTTTAQGDFARTSDGLANSTRIMKAELGDAAAILGAQLLPIVTQVVQTVTGWLASFRELSPEAQKIIVVVLAIVAGIGPLLIIIGSLISAITAIGPVVIGIAGILSFPLIAIIVAVVAIIALLALAWRNNWGGIREIVASAVAFISNIIRVVFAAIQVYFAVFFQVVSTIFQAFKAAFSGDWTKFGELLRQAWDTAWNAIKTIFSNAWESLKTGVANLIRNVIDFFTKTDWGEVGMNIVRGIANGITSAIQWVVAAISGMARAIIAAIKGFLGIKSPSKVFEGLGILSGQGFALGLMKATGTVRIAGAGMAASAMGGVVNNSHVTNNLTVYSNSETASVVSDFGRMRAWARA